MATPQFQVIGAYDAVSRGAFAVSPNGTKKVLAQVHNSTVGSGDHIYRSTDGGANWSDIGAPVAATTLSNQYNSYSVAIEDDGTVYAVNTTQSPSTFTLHLWRYNGSWSDISTPTAISQVPYFLFYDGTTFFAPVVDGSGNLRIYWSANSGATWSTIFSTSIEPGGTGTNRMDDGVLLGGFLHARTPAGSYRLNLADKLWDVVTTPAPADGLGTNSIIAGGHGSTSTVFVVTYSGSGITVHQSTDSGDTFSTVTMPSVPGTFTIAGPGFGADGLLHLYGRSGTITGRLASIGSDLTGSGTWSAVVDHGDLSGFGFSGALLPKPRAGSYEWDVEFTASAFDGSTYEQIYLAGRLSAGWGYSVGHIRYG